MSKPPIQPIPEAENGNGNEKPARLRFVLAFVPLLVFAALVGVFFTRIGNNSADLPSVLIGKSIPTVDLEPLAGLDSEPGTAKITNADFVGKTTIVNFWASWCAPCREEHPLLLQLAKDKRFQLIGINYKDDPGNALRFLGQLGNPFTRVGIDPKGKNAINWGVYGIPESFIIDKNGVIAYKQIGPLSPDVLAQDFLPALEKAAGIAQK